MAIIGYARTSTREQEAGLQADYSSTASLPGAVDMGGAVENPRRLLRRPARCSNLALTLIFDRKVKREK